MRRYLDTPMHTCYDDCIVPMRAAAHQDHKQCLSQLLEGKGKKLGAEEPADSSSNSALSPPPGKPSIPILVTHPKPFASVLKVATPVLLPSVSKTIPLPTQPSKAGATNVPQKAHVTPEMAKVPQVAVPP